jgi:uncharacterized protein (TIGR01777 family)
LKILITGGTGFIGSKLVPSLLDKGHEVAILTRRTPKDSGHRALTYLQWNGQEMPAGIGLYEVVINLAGASIAGKRWTDEQKDRIMNSRVHATRACVNYINRSPRKPQLFLSASAVGYYGVEHEGEIDESAAAGTDFAAEVCRVWEAEAEKAHCRTIRMRIGVVLGQGGGALEQMLPIYKKYLGGKFGSGKQGFPWIHIDDIVGAMEHFLETPDLEGAFNLTGPEIVDQGSFSNALADALGTKDFFIVPGFVLKIMFGEMAVLFLGGQKARPDHLIKAGYAFKFPDLPEALADVVT